MEHYVHWTALDLYALQSANTSAWLVSAGATDFRPSSWRCVCEFVWKTYKPRIEVALTVGQGAKISITSALVPDHEGWKSMPVKSRWARSPHKPWCYGLISGCRSHSFWKLYLCLAQWKTFLSLNNTRSPLLHFFYRQILMGHTWSMHGAFWASHLKLPLIAYGNFCKFPYTDGTSVQAAVVPALRIYNAITKKQMHACCYMDITHADQHGQQAVVMPYTIVAIGNAPIALVSIQLFFRSRNGRSTKQRARFSTGAGWNELSAWLHIHAVWAALGSEWHLVGSLRRAAVTAAGYDSTSAFKVWQNIWSELGEGTSRSRPSMPNWRSSRSAKTSK